MLQANGIPLETGVENARGYAFGDSNLAKPSTMVFLLGLTCQMPLPTNTLGSALNIILIVFEGILLGPAFLKEGRK